MNAPATVTLIATKAARPPLERLLVDVAVSNYASHRAPGDKEVNVSMTGVSGTPVQLSAP